jgi:hypothetical protein
MVAMLLRFVGIDLKRLARDAAITVALAVCGAFAAILALGFGVGALYLWLELTLGVFAALGILGGSSALLAIVLFAVAFRRAPRKPRAVANDALQAAIGPAQTSAASIVRVADEAVKGATDFVRDGSRQQIASTIAVAALIGLLIGRRSGRS